MKNIKTTLATITCVICFTLGWGLTITGFFLPPQGEVSESVLFILGQSMIYTAAVLGIDQHYSVKLSQFKEEMNREYPLKEV